MIESYFTFDDFMREVNSTFFTLTGHLPPIDLPFGFRHHYNSGCSSVATTKLAIEKYNKYKEASCTQ